MEQTVFYVILVIIIMNYLLERILSYLNLKNMSPVLPPEAKDIYDEEKYRKSQQYHKESGTFSFIASTFSVILILAMLLLKGFAFIDEVVRSITEHPVLMTLLFFGILGVASDILSVPFELYDTFVIEEKFGFNKTSIKTFITDKLKGYILGAIIGGGIISIVVWIYQTSGEVFWLLAWMVVSLFTVLGSMFYASLILPLFNKLSPLEKGGLRAAIEEYCRKVGFKLENLYVIDGSKRSAKANAFFSGLGPKKKIVLYDTLIEKHTTEELVAVLAHEVGHYKKKHTFQSIILSVLQTGIMLFILSLFIGSPVLSGALGSNKPSFHLGILVFTLLYSPIGLVLGILMNILSRKNEYEADNYAKKTYSSTSLADALKKLSVDNLSNLTPHPAYVFFHYSHPPLLDRLRNLRT